MSDIGTLALTRKAGQIISIGDNIAITVVSINRDNVRLAIRAPKVLQVLRLELLPPNELNESLQLALEAQRL